MVDTGRQGGDFLIFDQRSRRTSLVKVFKTSWLLFVLEIPILQLWFKYAIDFYVSR